MSKYIPKAIVKQAKQIDLLTYFMNNNPSELVKKCKKRCRYIFFKNT